MAGPERVEILGIPIDTVSEDDVLQRVDAAIKENSKVRILAVNPEKVMRAMREPELATILRESEVLIPDGIGVVIAVKWLHRCGIKRLPGADLMLALCRKAQCDGLSIFLLGASEETAKRAQVELSKMFPGLKIAGHANGYEDLADVQGISRKLQIVKPHMLFVALGSPFQEKWIRANLERLPVNVVQGVGGTFDVIAGTVKRAPAIWQRLGLEWLYRLIEQPSRIKRQYVLPIFLLRVLVTRLSKPTA